MHAIQFTIPNLVPPAPEWKAPFVAESIDLINWNAYQAPLEGVLTGFLHSVSGLFACHAIDHQPWARREKEKEKDGVGRPPGSVVVRELFRNFTLSTPPTHCGEIDAEIQGQQLPKSTCSIEEEASTNISQESHEIAGNYIVII